jgi:hypothetical protein
LLGGFGNGHADVSADVSSYTDLITSEYANQPNFVAAVAALCQGQADNQAILAGLAQLFDIDVAVGSQEDAVGLWVGRSRQLLEPLAGVYFSFDVAGVGFDQGTWIGPFDPTTGLVSLSDDAYRTYLQFGVASNQWDGTIPGIYAALNIIYPPGSGVVPLICDNGNMTMTVVVIGSTDAVTDALFEDGLLVMRPDGVEIAGIYVDQKGPVFCFDAEGPNVAGFDVGYWLGTAFDSMEQLTTPDGTPITTPDGTPVTTP